MQIKSHELCDFIERITALQANKTSLPWYFTIKKPIAESRF